MAVVYGVPAAVVDLVQKGLLERAFHDGLFPGLLYRNEAMVEEWPANSGETLVMSRPGLLAPAITPLTPGTDPSPTTVAYEQWVATLQRYGGTIDTHMPTAAIAAANIFLRNVHQLGLQAAVTLNRLPRNAMFKAYLSGQTCLTAGAAAAATTVSVASLNGFRDVVALGTAGATAPLAVSAGNPLAATIGGEAVSIIGVTPAGADLDGPGTLTLAAGLVALKASRASVVSAAAPSVIRATTGTSVDALTSSSLFTLQNAIDATNLMRAANVMPHEDGFYHAHISPVANGQIFQDAAWRQLHQSLPDGAAYQQGFIGTIAGIMFYMNVESPTNLNSGTLTATGGSAKYASDIGAEVLNTAGVAVGRVLVTGRGALYEKYLDESQYISEAGVTGKIGEFSIVNQGLAIVTERVRLIIRAPLDRLQDMVATTWSCSTSFTCPSDVSSGGPQRYKRCVIIEHGS
jgi:hypothetical protein